jgi:hypothetical protein
MRNHLCLLPLLLAVSCGGMGNVSTKLVDLYDLVDPAGHIEIEVDRGGTVREMEADVPFASLPEAVRKATKEHMPNATVVGAEREIKSIGDCWEVKLSHEGRSYELIFDDAGKLLESEKSVSLGEVPPLVKATAEAQMPGPTWKSIEVIERGGAAIEYHFKKDLKGASFKVVVAADGVLMRKVREQRAEIEIPVRD